jgi:hypothetical protein
MLAEAARIRDIPDHEECSAIDADGKVVFTKVGQADQIRFAPEDFDKMQGCTFIHNHPGAHKYEADDPRHLGVSLSTPDIMTAVVHGMPEVVAVSVGYTHSMKIPPEFVEQEYEKVKTSEIDAIVSQPNTRITKAYVVVKETVEPRLDYLNQKVRRGYEERIDALAGPFHTNLKDQVAAERLCKVAQAEHQHDVNTMLAEEMGWEYTRTRYAKPETKQCLGQTHLPTVSPLTATRLSRPTVSSAPSAHICATASCGCATPSPTASPEKSGLRKTTTASPTWETTASSGNNGDRPRMQTKRDYVRDDHGQFAETDGGDKPQEDKPKSPADSMPTSDPTGAIDLDFQKYGIRTPSPIEDTEADAQLHRTKFMTKFETGLLRSEDSGTGVSDENAMHEEDAMRGLLQRVPAEGLKRLNDVTNKVIVYRDIYQLSKQTGPKRTDGKVDLLGGAAGLERPNAGNNNKAGAQLRLDGGKNTGDKYAKETSDHYAAHEIGHVVDFSYGNLATMESRLSNSEAWKSAYYAEINPEPTKTGKDKVAPLSDYATVDPSEGFAEFCRLAWGRSPWQVEKFPKCHAILKARGLVKAELGGPIGGAY